ncbi:hypothetical protein AQF98_00035 [Pedobacter sp. Hv1]|nr:hypothetical protein AQF98_00035 [Pedobacter sp. Hv1]
MCFVLLLSSNSINAQTGTEIKFKILGNSSSTSKDLITVSTIINAKQPLAGNGIHFTLVVKNNANNAISLKNIIDRLTVSLYNDRGFNISIPNTNPDIINRRAEDRKWRFRSETVVPDDQVSINGRIEKSDIKKMEFIDIPAGGEWKINLIIKNVKQVETPEDQENSFLKPAKSLSPGKYKLRLSLVIAPSEQNKSAGKSGAYIAPFIDIEYN